MSTASRAALRCGSPTTSISSKSSCGSSKRRSAGAAAHDSHSDSEDEADDEVSHMFSDGLQEEPAD